MRAVALRYALAPACVLLAVLLYLSPAQPVISPAGPFLFAVLAAAWFGGPGPGFLAAALATRFPLQSRENRKAASNRACT